MNIDITDRRRTLLALKESEEKYRLLVENAQDVIANIDGEGRYLLVNQAAARFFNRSPSDIVGKFLWEVFPKEGTDMYENGILQVMRAGKAFVKEGQYTIRGELKWFRTKLQPIQNSSGQTTSVLILSTDISNQKKEEARARARLRLLENLRQAGSIDDCLTFGCQAIYDARLFKRAVLTLHNSEREIQNLGQIGLDPSVISAAKSAPAPSQESINVMLRDDYRISKSFFVPSQSAVMEKIGERYIPQKGSLGRGPDFWRAGDELFVPLRGKDNAYEGWLSVDTPFDGKRPTQEIVHFLEEVVDITAKQVHEMQSLERLKHESRALQEKNIALREVLATIEDDKMEIKMRIGANVAQILMPALNKLVRRDGSVNPTYLKLLKNGLPELITATGAMVDTYSKLTPREREIYNMIKSGNTSKEIAENLNIAPATVKKHREIIRRKLGIANKKINLVSYLKEK